MILTADGYIVTTCQVVDGASVIRVQLYDGRTFDATPVGQDTYADIAVIKIAATDLAPGVFGQSDILKQGDPVIAIGSPSNTSEQYRYIMNNGILSGMRNAADRQQTLLLSNVTLPGDNIGCPLLNRHGQIIGIHTQALRPAGIEGLRSAIPSATVKEAAEQLIRIRNNGRPSLGLTGSFLSTLDALYYRLPYGFYITAVAPDSDAAVKGIRPGDILTEFAGESVTDINQLKSRLYRYSIGDTVGVTIYRNGEELFLELTLTESHEEP